MATSHNDYHYGTIKVYFPLKGFGFITREKGKDLFFYHTSIENESSIIEGIPVKFKIDSSNVKLRAIEILRNG